MRLLVLALLYFFSDMDTLPSPELDIQGHRGCRGLLPENTIPAFKRAVELGVNTLEMDVVISADKQVVVSHDPWFSSEICSDPQGKPISPETEKDHKLISLNYEQIKNYDCGSRGHKRFPQQTPQKTYKPLLSEVFDAIEGMTDKAHRVHYNIEIKSLPEWDHVFTPEPAEFSELVVKVVHHHKLQERVIIQSFDPRTLNYIHSRYPGIKLALLVENKEGIEQNLSKLSFSPYAYSPEYILLEKDSVDLLKKKGMQVIPWTINKESDMKRIVEMGVDGIITDYPDIAVKLFKH